MPSPSNALPAVLVIGRGRLGGSMTRTGSELGLTLAGRDDAAALAGSHDAVLLCVPDSAIESACAALLESGARPCYVGHTSGARGLEAVAEAAAAGCETYCLHPLQTVPTSASPLAGAPAAIDGSSADALSLAHNLATSLGMVPFELPADSRAAYHAAACIASNFLITLEESAAALLEAAGVEGGRELLGPLVAQSAANWIARGPDALTGPIARGDRETVERHLAAIEDLAPELRPLYEALADQTMDLARTGIEAGR